MTANPQNRIIGTTIAIGDADQLGLLRSCWKDVIFQKSGPIDQRARAPAPPLTQMMESTETSQ